MFNLDQSIAEWRRQMAAGGVKAPGVLDELESHLRADVEQRLVSGLGDQQALEVAIRHLGAPGPIKQEFGKIQAENWNRPLARIAWAMFVVSFFLPAYIEVWGWQCAWLSVTAVSWADVSLRNWGAIHLGLLPLANLLMVASPFLLARFSRNTRFLKWLRYAIFAALVLVWSYLLLLIANKAGGDLKVGCYVWAVSFLLLFLSTFRRRGERVQYV